MDDSPEDGPLFDPRITSYNWLAGVLGGVVTFVAGYLVMAATILMPDGPPEGLSLRELLAEIGRVFYNAHQVTLDLRPASDNVEIEDAPNTVNWSDVGPDSVITINTELLDPNQTIVWNADVEQMIPYEQVGLYVFDFSQYQEPVQHAQEKPELLYRLVPVIVLIAAGATLAYLTLSDSDSIHEAVLPAVAFSGGYTAVAVLGTFFVGQELAGGAVVLSPNLGQTIVFALMYSLLCGLLGSYAISAWRDRNGPIANH
ncbi:hypothetical protein [Halapricum desulfuricans]|uniref:Putative membrane protein n=1 Tax=Halapricum desulfuricans TaxID=2841257 RepID=A0A897NPZ8_9EURY|nr:hypothetical protein [Halapricum desulfuricans]QSG14524.1 putative membrane protein [Halapricum desulfuricans]